MSSESANSFSLDTIVESLKKATETLSNLALWVAELWRERNWFKLLVLLDVILLAILAGAKGWLPILPQFPLNETQQQYLLIAVGIVFVVAVIVAVRTMPSLKLEPDTYQETRSIKGLRAFTRQDAEIFRQLQRNRSIDQCIETITNPHFRFDILVGESGCGKTSLSEGK